MLVPDNKIRLGYYLWERPNPALEGSTTRVDYGLILEGKALKDFTCLIFTRKTGAYHNAASGKNSLAYSTRIIINKEEKEANVIKKFTAVIY